MYDQVIIQFLTGTKDDVITDSSAALAKKAKAKGLATTVVTISCHAVGIEGEVTDKGAADSLKNALAKLTGSSRLYVSGHGSWKSQMVGGVYARQVAQVLKRYGLRYVGRVSVVSCEAGYGPGGPSDAFTSGKPRVGPDARQTAVACSAGSFGEELLVQLKEFCQIETVVYARLGNATTLASGRKEVDLAGEKEQWVHHAANTKMRFYWLGGQPVREPVLYSARRKKVGGTKDVRGGLDIGVKDNYAFDDF
jgi:Peptidase C80 family